jgi:hypothetical protein
LSDSEKAHHLTFATAEEYQKFNNMDKNSESRVSCWCRDEIHKHWDSKRKKGWLGMMMNGDLRLAGFRSEAMERAKALNMDLKYWCSFIELAECLRKPLGNKKKYLE